VIENALEIAHLAQRLVEDEAEHLDGRQYRDWLELFSEDAVYWVPLREGQANPSELNVLLDDRSRMENRIDRLEGGHAHSQIPPSRTSRSVTNFRTAQESDEIVVVSSRFILFEYRRGVQRLYGGRYTHHVRLNGDRLLIKSKRVDLVNSEARLGNVTFLL